MSITADEQFYEDVPFWTVNVNIQDRKPYKTTNYKAWWKRIRHEGFYESVLSRDSQSQVPSRCVDYYKKETCTPMLLNVDGSQLTIPTPPQVASANWLEFQVFGYVAFGAMGF